MAAIYSNYFAYLEADIHIYIFTSIHRGITLYLKNMFELLKSQETEETFLLLGKFRQIDTHTLIDVH